MKQLEILRKHLRIVLLVIFQFVCGKDGILWTYGDEPRAFLLKLLGWNMLHSAGEVRSVKKNHGRTSKRRFRNDTSSYLCAFMGPY